jgi:hypothetical protein
LGRGRSHCGASEPVIKFDRRSFKHRSCRRRKAVSRVGSPSWNTLGRIQKARASPPTEAGCDGFWLATAERDEVLRSYGARRRRAVARYAGLTRMAGARPTTDPRDTPTARPRQPLGENTSQVAAACGPTPIRYARGGRDEQDELAGRRDDPGGRHSRLANRSTSTADWSAGPAPGLKPPLGILLPLRCDSRSCPAVRRGSSL